MTSSLQRLVLVCFYSKSPQVISFINAFPLWRLLACGMLSRNSKIFPEILADSATLAYNLRDIWGPLGTTGTLLSSETPFKKISDYMGSSLGDHKLKRALLCMSWVIYPTTDLNYRGSPWSPSQESPWVKTAHKSRCLMKFPVKSLTSRCINTRLVLATQNNKEPDSGHSTRLIFQDND